MIRLPVGGHLREGDTYFFKHAVADELIEPGILQRLQAVAPLLAGRTEAPDLPPRTSVQESAIEAVKERVSDLVGDLIDL